MANYMLAESYGRSNIQDRLWYAKAEADITTMLTDSGVNLQFGDKVYVIATGNVYIFDGTEWKSM